MNIVLDKWQAKDYIDFYNASNDDYLRKNMNDDFPKTLEQCKGIVSFFANSTDTTECVRAIKSDGIIIGCIAAFFKAEKDSKIAELAYWLSKEYRGQGIMTKVITAFTDMLLTDFSVHRVAAKPLEHNTASQKVLLKSGFKVVDENKQEYIMIQRLGNEK